MRPDPGYRRLMLGLAALLFTCVAGASPTREDADRLAGPPPGGVTGRVLDLDGHPLAGVKVTIELREEKQIAVTDERGDYCFCRMAPARDYVLRMEREGFARIEERDLVILPRKLAILNAILQPLSSFKQPESNGGK
jgi:carboxypeptidase family protein